MATMKDVARAAGVSVTTVSATINETAPVSAETRRRVTDAIKAVGYAPDPVARHLRSGQSTTVGLVIPDISTPYFAHLAKALHHALSEHGYRLFLSSNGGDPDAEIADIESFVAHRVAGLMVAPTSLGTDIGERLNAAIRVPAVVIDRVVPHARFDVVADDNHLGAALITRYLLHLGHKDIGFLAGREGISSSDERLAGYLAAMAEASVPVRQDLIARRVHTHDLALAEAQRMMIMPNPPTALVTINNAQTKGVMTALKGMGMRAPREVSVISFDGFHASEGWDPAITSLQQDMTAISREATLILMRIMGGDATPGAPAIVRVPPTFAVRESCHSVGPPLV